MMLIWLDNHISPKFGQWLANEMTCEVAHVRDLGFAAAPDQEIFQAAKKAGAIVLTKDADWVEIGARLGAPPQLIWLRFGNTSTKALIARFRSRIPAIRALLEADEPLIELHEID